MDEMIEAWRARDGYERGRRAGNAARDFTHPQAVAMSAKELVIA